MTLAEQSELMRMRLLMGLCPVAAVTQWADELILRDQATPEVIDVSVAQTTEPLKLAEMLKQIDPAAARTLGAHAALAEFGKELPRLPIDDAMHRLIQYMNWASIDWEEASAISGMEDELYCARQGYWGSENSVRKSMERFVSKYAAVRLTK